jgi:hypothetical protein
VSVWKRSVGVSCLRLASKQHNASNSFKFIIFATFVCVSHVTTCEQRSGFYILY